MAASQTSKNLLAAHSLSTTSGDALLADWPHFGVLLRERAAAQPGQVFLRYFDDDAHLASTLTFAEFAAEVDRAARFLAAQGLKAGDCLATLSWNHPTAAALLFAGWSLGLVVAPQNVSEDDARLRFILDDAEAILLVAHPDLAGRARDICGARPVFTFAALEANAELLRPHVEERRGAVLVTDHRTSPALIVYTSGTTGQPKGVVLTQHNLMVNAVDTVAWHALGPRDAMMCVLPIHHVNGIVVTLITSLMAGATLVLNKGFKISTFWKRLAENRVAIVSVVPTILQFLNEGNEDLSGHDLSAFRHFVCGAGTLPVSLVEKFEDRFGVVVQHGYGLSETTAFACAMPNGLDRAARRDWYARFGYPSIGTPWPRTEMAIHDAEGRALAPVERGEIVIRGPSIMAGYHHRDEANAETFKHGWFRSGDEGFFERDAEGRAYFFITGRLKELINRGGAKYSPFEIEEVLLTVPGVKAGLAIAFDNDWYGEEVGAYVVLEEGASISGEFILAFCRERLPFAKSPKVVVFGTDIPVTVTGKYQRLKLKPLFAEWAVVQFRSPSTME